MSENVSEKWTVDVKPHQPRRSEGARREPSLGDMERWVSTMLGGTLAVLGLTRRSTAGTVVALLGGYLFYRGATGQRPLAKAMTTPRGDRAVAGERGLEVDKSVTINKPAAELYRFWRDFENLPRFMNHLESVKTQGGRSHWVAKAPLGQSVEWDAEVTEEKDGEFIAWRSLPGADVANAGSVRFAPAPGGRGTEVRVSLAYRPPAGALGAAIAKLFGEEPEMQVGDDLSRFKALMEAGEVATTRGQPSGRGRD